MLKSVMLRVNTSRLQYLPHMVVEVTYDFFLKLSHVINLQSLSIGRSQVQKTVCLPGLSSVDIGSLYIINYIGRPRVHVCI